MRSLAENRDVLTGEGLTNEVAHHPPIEGMHVRSVGIEDTSNPDIDMVLSVIVEKKCLGGPLALVVTRPPANRIDVAAVGLRLR